MFETTLAGSLPKPAWLSETQKLWPQWKLAGDDLAAAKLDATLLCIKAQQDAGLDMQWVPKDRLFPLHQLRPRADEPRGRRKEAAGAGSRALPLKRSLNVDP